MTSLATAEALAEIGMQRALDFAEFEHPNWAAVALLFLKRYARSHRQFISEEVTAAADYFGLVQPSNTRAWGQIYKRAAKEGVIVCCGMGKSARRHGSVCPMWRSEIYRDGT